MFFRVNLITVGSCSVHCPWVAVPRCIHQRRLPSISSNQRVVTVRGLCEKEVTANKVTWPIVSKEVGNDLNVIYRNIQKTNSAIVGFLEIERNNRFRDFCQRSAGS